MSKVKKARVKTYLVATGEGTSKMIHDVVFKDEVLKTFEGKELPLARAYANVFNASIDNTKGWQR